MTASGEEEQQSYKARVHVFPRREILDPQGKAIGAALERLGFESVDDVRAGKAFDLEIRAGGFEEAEERVRAMSEKLLANPITEDFAVSVELAGTDPEAES